MMSHFQKPSFSIEQQLSTLEERGLIINDKKAAQHSLKNISYFRLSAYTLPFYKPNLSKKHFLPGTSFSHILNLYSFDRQLRLMILDAIERIEVALRSQVGNILADNHGPHGYMNPAIFNTRYNHRWLMDKLDCQGNKREMEVFLGYYLTKYPESPKQPPIWMALELLSFSEVSRLFGNLRQNQDIQPIEHYFGWKFPVLRSWFRSLAELRNLCAHHNRVWNREFGTKPMIPKNIPEDWPIIPESISSESIHFASQRITSTNRLYFLLVIIESFLRIISSGSMWSFKLAVRMANNSNISLPRMGFPEGWRQEPFWRKPLL